MTMPDVVYLNGRFLPRAEARVSPEDRGFLLGDGVFDTLRTYNGRFFRFEEHARRFFKGLEETRIPAPFDRDELRRILDSLRAENQMEDAVARITVTRGAGLGGYRIDPSAPPTVYASLRPIPDVAALRASGVTLSLSGIPRPLPFLSVVKTTSVGAMALARSLASTYEVVMTDAEGFVAECSAASLFILDGNRLVSPPMRNLLPSVTRGVIERDFPLEERRLAVEDLERAEAIMISSTSTGPLPVSRFEETSYDIDGGGVRAVLAAYDRRVREECG